MALWALTLGLLLLMALGHLCLLHLRRQRRPGEPPLDKGHVPWLGHAMAFRKNMFKFLKGMREKHGDIFTVQFGGQYFTFVMDPLSYGPILKDTKRRLDFVSYARQLVFKVFGYRSLDGDHQMIHAASTKYLMGPSLQELNKVMLGSLSLVILGPEGRGPGHSGWYEEGLFTFCYKVLFMAGYLALFGFTRDKEQDVLQAQALFSEFRKFDALFPRFVYSLLGPREWWEIGRLQRLFYKMVSVRENREKEGVSSWLSFMLQYLREQEVPGHMQDKFNFMMLWASQGNTGPSSFWTLAFLLKHPEAMQAVQKEATQLLGEARLKDRQPFQVDLSVLRHTPVLDSVMEESLRLGASPTLLRLVQEDCALKMASGQEYLVRQGDIVALFPYLSVHMDPDIHRDPTAFQYDRFLNPDGSRKVDFYKAGRKIHHYSMPWGAGVSICPGRFFALSEMKLFLLLMVTHFDLELLDPATPVPPVDPNRWGFGTTQPAHDLRFRYRLRPHE